MRELTLNDLKTNPKTKPHFDWLQEWTQDALRSCFRFLALELEPFEFFFSDDAACMLMDGCGTVDGKAVLPLSAFGVRITDQNQRGVETVSQRFKASEKSILVCFNKNIFNNVCFGMGCGSMHTRYRELILNNMIN